MKIKQCVICGSDFVAFKGKKTCCADCKKILYSRTIKKKHTIQAKERKSQKKKYIAVCPVCGKEFITYSRCTIYCSQYCKYKAYGMRSNGIVIPDPPQKVLAEEEQKKKSKGLDDVMVLCREKGISYKEWQMAQTKKMINDVEVESYGR